MDIMIDTGGKELMCEIADLPVYPQFVSLDGYVYAHVGDQAHGPNRGHYRNLEAVPVLKVMGVIEPQDASMTPLSQ